jgi:hypothetical protein
MHRMVLFVLPLIALLGLSFAGTANAATADTYTVTRTVGPYNGAAKLGEKGSVPDGEASSSVGPTTPPSGAPPRSTAAPPTADPPRSCASGGTTSGSTRNPATPGSTHSSTRPARRAGTA